MKRRAILRKNGENTDTVLPALLNDDIAKEVAKYYISFSGNNKNNSVQDSYLAGLFDSKYLSLDLDDNSQNRSGHEGRLEKDYNEAVSNNDMETAQRLVNEVAKRAGYLELAYHGSRNIFNEFSRDKLGQCKIDRHIIETVYIFI